MPSFFFLVLILLACASQTDAEITLQGTTRVLEKIGKIELNCTYEKSSPLERNIHEMFISRGRKFKVILTEKFSGEVVANKQRGLQASGFIDNISGRAYMYLTLSEPSRDAAGVYTCSALSVGDDGQVKTWTSTPLNVALVKPSKSEVVNFLSGLISGQLTNIPNTIKDLDKLVEGLNQNRSKVKDPTKYSNKTIKPTKSKNVTESSKQIVTEITDSERKPDKKKKKIKEEVSETQATTPDTDFETQTTTPGYIVGIDGLTILTGETNVQAEVAILKTAFNDLRKNLDELRLERAPQTESGQLAFGVEDGGFPDRDEQGYSFKEKAVVFHDPFSIKPIVTYSVRYVDIGGRNGVQYLVKAQNITQNGFTLKCASWGSSIIKRITVLWTAIKF